MPNELAWFENALACLAGTGLSGADPHQFPALARFIAAGVFEADDGPDDEFISGLERILDGVQALVGDRD